MHARGIPKGFWDRVFCYYLELRSHLALGHHLQEGECGTTIVTGETADISHLVDFSIFDWCWALSPRQSTQDAKQLCRWLGPSFTVGGALCFAVTTASAQVLHRSSVIPLKIEERNSDDIKRLKNDFMDCLKDNLRKKAEGISLRPEDILDLEKKFGIEPKPLEAEEIPYFDPYEDHTFDQPEHSGRDEFDDVFEEPPVSEEEDPEAFDQYISSRVLLNREGTEAAFGRVLGRKRGRDNKFIGNYHPNPMLDTSVYEVEFADGNVESYFANQIAEAMISCP